MRNCRNCGFPGKFARYFDWRSDGTIVSTDRTGIPTQICFLADGELEGLFSNLSRTIGMPVEPFLIQAQKRIGKAVLANLWLARLLVGLTASDFAGLGDGRISVEKYRAGHTLVLRFRNPCLVPLLVGSACGIYESVEEMPAADFDYTLSEGDLVIRLSHGSGRQESEDRLLLEEVVPGKGMLKYERCPLCNTPLLSARTFGWDIKKGIITNRLSCGREVVVAAQSVNAILRELELELGEEIRGALYDHQKEYAVDRLSSEDVVPVHSFWQRILKGMALRGLGYPDDFHYEGTSVSVKVSNP